MSILTAGMGLNITCVSYRGEMNLGIIVDPNLVPDHQTLAAGLDTALEEYLAQCKPQPARGKVKKAAAKTPRRKKTAAKKASVMGSTKKKSAAATGTKSAAQRKRK